MKKEQIFLSTIAPDAVQTAEKYHLGIELAQFCYAVNMDRAEEKVDRLAAPCLRAGRRIFHAPFAELSPAAIDPLVLEVTRKRYARAVELALRFSCEKVVIHSAFVPNVYFSTWFLKQFVVFWRDFLKNYEKIPTICIENVMDTDPQMLPQAVAEVDDPRLRLCLDVGHANLTDAPIEKWIDAFLPQLSHVHIHNNFGKTDEHRALFDGKLDMPAILDRIGGGMSYTLEVREAESSVKWLLEQGRL